MVPEVTGSNPVFHPKLEEIRTPKVFGFFCDIQIVRELKSMMSLLN